MNVSAIRSAKVLVPSSKNWRSWASVAAGSNASRLLMTAWASSCPSRSDTNGATASNAIRPCPRLSVAISSRISEMRSVWSRSSISSKAGDMCASTGKRRKTEAQKEWIVWIFKPPGASTARANSVRAWASVSVPRSSSATPNFAKALINSASANIAHLPSCEKRRFCISAAAALV